MKKMTAAFLFLLFMASQAKTFAESPAHARVLEMENKSEWKMEGKEWAAVSKDTPLPAGAEIKTGEKGKLTFELPDKSRLSLDSETELQIETLQNSDLHTFIQISLKQGIIKAEVTPETAEAQAFIVSTRSATIVPEGTKFSVQHVSKKEETTVMAEKGFVYVQPDNNEIEPIDLPEGRQMTLNLKEAAPILNSKTLNKPVDLGWLQVCETWEKEKEICGSWSWDSTEEQFNGEWQNGARSVLKVKEIKNGHMILTRSDLPAPSKLTVEYTGHNAGNEVTGDVIVPIIEGTLSGTSDGTAIQGTWKARSQNILDLG